MDSLEWEPQLDVLTIQEGDIIVARFKRVPSVAGIKSFGDALRAALAKRGIPNIQVIMTLKDEVDLSAMTDSEMAEYGWVRAGKGARSA